MHTIPGGGVASPQSQPPSRGVSHSSGDSLGYGDGTGPYGKLFACPYFKHNPEQSADRRSCSKSGWTTIHSLRQHIYRCHTSPMKFSNCRKTLDSSSGFKDHLHPTDDDHHCETEEPIKGLENLFDKQGPIKSTTNDVPEEEVWRAIYTTIFPNDAKSNMPYPYVDQHQQVDFAVSPYESGSSTPSRASIRSTHTPSLYNPHHAQRASHMLPGPTPGSSHQLPLSGNSSRGSLFVTSNEKHCQCQSPKPPSPVYSRPQDGSRESHIFNPMFAREDYYQTPQTPRSPETRSLEVSPSPNGRTTPKDLDEKSMEFQVTAFKAWDKPHRTDEHIKPGEYSGFWKYFARCLTFYIPSWFLRNFCKMHDVRRRLAFRQKLFFCILLAAIYAVICYFLVFQPLASCVVKIDVGMFENDGPFCYAVRWVIYVYMGLGALFMLLVAICAARVRYRSRKFEESDAMVVMHIPCYNEDESTLRKTIDSCIETTYDKNRKVLFIVADGMVAAEGQKPTYKVLLEDIFEHNADPEAGIDNQARAYTSFDSHGVSDNFAQCYTGFFKGVPYVIVIKVGREDEHNSSKPGNRGKRDSQLLVYNFFHYVNYRRLWTPLFENIEFQMRACLNLDASEAMHMLVVDCDTMLHKTGVSYLVHQLQKNPKALGVCGYTGVNNPFASFVALAQVFEYWLTHAVLKAVESTCSNVLVLSGCFTIYRLKWPNNRPAILHPLLLEDYAGSYDKTLHEHNLLSIGEDRYLSTLAIRYFGSDCRLQYFPAASCTTTVPTTLSVLLDQRRRWTNSLIHCHFAHLNVLPFEASLWTQLRLLFVIGAELFMVFILPLALPAGLVLAVVSVLLTDYAWVILLAFCLLPLIICVICSDWKYIPFYIPFFPMISVFSIIIPLFSMWKQDNIKWGKTRDG